MTPKEVSVGSSGLKAKVSDSSLVGEQKARLKMTAKKKLQEKLKKNKSPMMTHCQSIISHKVTSLP